MKCILVLIMLAATAYGEHQALILDGGSAANEATTLTTNKYPQSGKLVLMTVSTSGGASTVTVSTVSSKGVSIGAARTLLPATVVTGSFQTNLNLYPLFLGEDYIVTKNINSTGTGTVSVKVGVVLER